MMDADWFFVFPLACALFDASAALAVLLCPWRLAGGDDRPVITVFRAVLAGLAAGSLFVAKLPLLLSLGVNRFGFVHFAYLELAVAVPIVGAVLLTLAWVRCGGRPVRRATRLARIIAAACLIPVPVGVYATFVEPYWLQMETAYVPVHVQREGEDDVKVGVLADIQTNRVTDYERAAVAQLMALEPDVILLPGDLFQGTADMFAREEIALRELLSQLSAPGGVFCVLGNIDRPRWVQRIVEGTQIRLLVNETVETRVGDRRLRIGGIEFSYSSAEARQTVEQLEGAAGADDIRILLAHTPDAVQALSEDTRVDLVVAGHTHGGQVCLPLIGPLVTATTVPRSVGAGGYHELNGRRIYVSRGVGHERGQAPRMRFLAPPETSLVVLSNNEP